MNFLAAAIGYIDSVYEIFLLHLIESFTAKARGIE